MPIPICSEFMGGCGHIGKDIKDWKETDNVHVCPVCKNTAIVELNKNNAKLLITDKKQLKKILEKLGVPDKEIKD